MERELRQKAAGLRTHTLVGVGAALIMIVSKYGFGDVFVRNLIAATRRGSPRRSCPASASSAPA